MKSVIVVIGAGQIGQAIGGRARRHARRGWQCLLMGPDGGFITGSDILMDGGVSAAYWFDDVGEVRS
jgi:hypothetical protein